MLRRLGNSSKPKEDDDRVAPGAVRRSYPHFDNVRERQFLRNIRKEYKKYRALVEGTLVSIVMPTYNRADRIAASIASILDQSHRNWELIIVDDGSIDSTVSVVSEQPDDRIKYHRTGHAGVSAARNFGLRAATGALVAYLDSDNSWHPAFLRTMVTFLVSQDLDAGYCAIVAFDDAKATKFYRGDIFDWRACLQQNYIDLNSFVHTGSLTASKGGVFFDETLYRLVDWDFILRLTANASVSYAPFVGVNYYAGADEARITVSRHVDGTLKQVANAIRRRSLQYRSATVDTQAGRRLSRRGWSFTTSLLGRRRLSRRDA